MTIEDFIKKFKLTYYRHPHTKVFYCPECENDIREGEQDICEDVDGKDLLICSSCAIDLLGRGAGTD